MCAANIPSELSGGMIKRVALARALALDPDIVFLDEPTSGLDPIGAAEFDELIRTLQRTLGLTVFMVTHDLDSLHTVCDRIAVLAEGRVIAAGPIETMLASEHPWLKSYFRGKRGRRRPALRQRREAIHGNQGQLRRDRRVHARRHRRRVRLHLLVPEHRRRRHRAATYRVVFDGSVSGLRTGAAVLFNGIRVGEVASSRSMPHEPHQVVAVISLDRAVPVRADTKVGLEFQGLTGLAEVSLDRRLGRRGAAHRRRRHAADALCRRQRDRRRDAGGARRARPHRRHGRRQRDARCTLRCTTSRP